MPPFLGSLSGAGSIASVGAGVVTLGGAGAAYMLRFKKGVVKDVLGAIGPRLDVIFASVQTLLTTYALVWADEKGVITNVNREAENITGYSKFELIGREVELLVPEASRIAHAQLRRNYLRNPQARPMGQGLPLSMVCKNGTELPVDIALLPINGNGAGGVLIQAALRVGPHHPDPGP